MENVDHLFKNQGQRFPAHERSNYNQTTITSHGSSQHRGGQYGTEDYHSGNAGSVNRSTTKGSSSYHQTIFPGQPREVWANAPESGEHYASSGGNYASAVKVRLDPVTKYHRKDEGADNYQQRKYPDGKENMDHFMSEFGETEEAQSFGYNTDKNNRHMHQTRANETSKANEYLTKEEERYRAEVQHLTKDLAVAKRKGMVNVKSGYGVQAVVSDSFEKSLATGKMKVEKILQELSDAIHDSFLEYENEKENLLMEVQSKLEYSKSHPSDGYGNTQSELQQLKVNYDKMEGELKKWKALYQTLEEKSLDSSQKLVEQIKSLKKENADLSSRLSTEMNVKVSSDETSIENISIKNRPMNIADEYRNLCSSQWLETKTALDEMLNNRSQMISDERRSKYLCDILLCAEIQVKVKQESTRQEIWKVLKKPYMGGYGHVAERPIPAGLNNAIGDLLRLSCEDGDLTSIITNVERNLSKFDYDVYNATWYKTSCKDKIREYIRASVQLAWKMVLQRPPMRFDLSGVNEGYEERNQEIAWGSDDPKYGPAVVKRYDTPALYHGDHVMVKGKVRLQYKK